MSLAQKTAVGREGPESIFSMPKSSFGMGLPSQRVTRDFSLNDITTGIDNYTAYRQTKDLEDNIQFCMSLKMKCHYFVTDNIKDYKDFTNISILPMKDYRTVEF